MSHIDFHLLKYHLQPLKQNPHSLDEPLRLAQPAQATTSRHLAGGSAHSWGKPISTQLSRRADWGNLGTPRTLDVSERCLSTARTHRLYSCTACTGFPSWIIQPGWVPKQQRTQAHDSWGATWVGSARPSCKHNVRVSLFVSESSAPFGRLNAALQQLQHEAVHLGAVRLDARLRCVAGGQQLQQYFRLPAQPPPRLRLIWVYNEPEGAREGYCEGPHQGRGEGLGVVAQA